MKRKEVGWIFGACRTFAPPRVRLSLAALGCGHGLNERKNKEKRDTGGSTHGGHENFVSQQRGLSRW